MLLVEKNITHHTGVVSIVQERRQFDRKSPVQ